MIRVSRVIIVIVSVGLVLGIVGLVMGILWSTIYSSIIQKQLSLTPLSTNYKLWKETPIPMYLKIYMFNLTNPTEFVNHGAKPNLVEMGPYVFKEVDYKMEQIWNKNNTITYQRKRVWHFDESLSNGSLSDSVTNINPVAASVGYTLRFAKSFFKYLVDKAMEILEEKLVITKTVNELLFEGFNDDILKLARAMNLTKIPMNKFAWFYERNSSASYDGTFNMDTGESNMLNLGLVREWNYNNRVSYYPGQCGVIRGTNGDLWPPLPDNKTVSFFVSDICTSLSATYSNTTVHEGLTGVMYVNDDTIFDNGTKVPSRKCYYLEDSIPSGAMNISLCKWGAPAFISLPHFYLADPSYRENINGMNPQKDKHQLSISLEPKTGVPLKVSAQLQLNLLLQPYGNMSMFKKMKKTFVPMLWFTQEATLTSDYADTVKLIIILQSLGSVLSYEVAGIGVIMIFIGIFVIIKRNMKGDDQEQLIARTANGEINE
ncbi:protein croquemort [Lasioglossum baleicum]|uniref:protein croquemort n=1 Tax=Lasioglossum baleicum TaxID=434251 RepID=UPI003FCEC5A1